LCCFGITSFGGPTLLAPKPSASWPRSRNRRSPLGRSRSRGYHGAAHGEPQDGLAEEMFEATDRHIAIPAWGEDDEEIPFVVAMQKATKDKYGCTVPGEYFVVWGDYTDAYYDYKEQSAPLSEILRYRNDQRWLRAHWIEP
jgi:hypothetical protein